MTRARNDPRKNRAILAVPSEARPRFDLAGLLSRRPRRNPHAEREAQRVKAAKPRFDVLLRVVKASATALAARPADVDAPREKPKTIILAEPAFFVLVVPDTANDKLTMHDRQVLAAARVLAGDDGGVVVLVDEACPDLAAAGADRRVTMPVVLKDGYNPDAQAAVVAATMAALPARHVLFAETADGGDLARRVAVLTSAGLFADAEGVTPKLLRRAARNRRVEQSAHPPRLITVATGAVAAYAGAPREARLVELERDAPGEMGASSILASGVVSADPVASSLALADFVVSAGNGVTDFAAFHALAVALAATPGASRVLCDAGMMPRDRQVGASGTVLAASCYFALGIAGAPQHLQGVADCEHVIAVNTDLHAAMIERADLAIVQDAQLVMPALLAALARETEGGVETPA